MEKIKVEFRSSDETGNIFHILHQTKAVLRKHNKSAEYNEMYNAVMSCNSYEEALKAIREKINLVDLDGKF